MARKKLDETAAQRQAGQPVDRAEAVLVAADTRLKPAIRTILIPKNPAPAPMKRVRGGDGLPCVICGLTVTKPKFECHLVLGGDHALHPEDEAAFAADTEQQRGDMGYYPVGTDCLRRFPEMRPFSFKAQALAA